MVMVYFLNDEERREAERLAREVIVDDELRGWNYLDGPMRPPYAGTLPLYIIANDVKFSSRREYEEYIANTRTNPSREMILGSLLHKTVNLVVEESKAFIFRYGLLSGSDLYAYLLEMKDGKIEEILAQEENAKRYSYEIVQYLNRLWLYESLQIAAALDRVLANGTKGRDTVVQKALPFTLEYEIDGRRLGLSERIRVDALGHFMVIFELKTGKASEYHKLATTGYALALESVIEHPVNVGCLVYLDFWHDRTTPIVKRYVHAIDDPLRRWFIEERDSKLEALNGYV